MHYVIANVYHLSNRFASFLLYGEVAAIVHCAYWASSIEAIREERLVFKAIFTDSHFWIPLFVLLLGIALLVFLR